MPIICFTHFAILDKLPPNYAAVYTLIEDLSLSGQRYSWTATIFNFGYFAGGISANYLMQIFLLQNSLRLLFRLGNYPYRSYWC